MSNPDYTAQARTLIRKRAIKLSTELEGLGLTIRTWPLFKYAALRYEFEAGVQLLAEAMELADAERKSRDSREQELEREINAAWSQS